MEENECPICLEVMFVRTNNIKRVKLPCNHWFHFECIKEFFFTKGIPICPYCMQEIIVSNSELILRLESFIVKVGSIKIKLPRNYDELLKILYDFHSEKQLQTWPIKSCFILPSNILKEFIQNRIENLTKRGYFTLEDENNYTWQN